MVVINDSFKLGSLQKTVGIKCYTKSDFQLSFQIAIEMQLKLCKA